MSPARFRCAMLENGLALRNVFGSLKVTHLLRPALTLVIEKSVYYLYI